MAGGKSAIAESLRWTREGRDPEMPESCRAVNFNLSTSADGEQALVAVATVERPLRATNWLHWSYNHKLQTSAICPLLASYADEGSQSLVGTKPKTIS